MWRGNIKRGRQSKRQREREREREGERIQCNIVPGENHCNGAIIHRIERGYHCEGRPVVYPSARLSSRYSSKING